MSYGYNMNIGEANTGNSIQGAVSKITEVDKCVLLYEVSGDVTDVTNPLEATDTTGDGYGASGNIFPGTSKLDTGYPWNPDGSCVVTSYYGYSGVGLHSNAANWLLGDGHVKWILPQKVSVGLTATADTPNTPFSGCGSPWQAAGSAVSTYAATFNPI